jgi:hypothetical protein
MIPVNSVSLSKKQAAACPAVQAVHELRPAPHSSFKFSFDGSGRHQVGASADTLSTEIECEEGERRERPQNKSTFKKLII